jgi:diacylglycerol kinase (ATP)
VKLTVLFNPAAGRGQARRVLESARDEWRLLAVEVVVRESRSPQHLVELAREAAREKPASLVSVGGDGTHHHVLNGLLGSDVPLALISAGTGNDLAGGLGIPADARKAARVAVGGALRRMDVVRVGKRLCAGVAGAGFDSVVNRYANESVTWLRGRPAYLWAILRCLGRSRSNLLRLEAEGQSFRGEALFAVVANNARYGGGVRITPRARLDDGLLDVCIVPPMGLMELLRWVPRAYRGEHLRHPRVVYFQTTRVTLASEDRLELFADGEFLQELPATLEALPRAIAVRVPPGSLETA